MQGYNTSTTLLNKALCNRQTKNIIFCPSNIFNLKEYLLFQEEKKKKNLHLNVLTYIKGTHIYEVMQIHRSIQVITKKMLRQ